MTGVYIVLAAGRGRRMGGPKAATVEARAVLVAANQPHWFECAGWVAVLWLEPHCLEARRLTARYLAHSPVVALPEAGLEGMAASFERRRSTSG